ncbi:MULTISPECIES: RNA polymerase-associated protein RapA [Cycloclasticus]|jgi:ATP-dependent helicase HepA|uniref:RNA polymerase-associated protein RapA n=1 Tax=Cycloclasticus zancles 78-ME TaxID=1198232 RepID=S5T6Z0_9GAMM|nr:MULTISPECIES: RNA polymerase-associated protein RapA [Cycloclasticus]AGS39284.1 Superfamily II DNA/RNA helicase, SNF2 family [Cycloclasticus zancles 78-ME]MBV1898935.1 RNA polymerase-associated protein RapA [Cycloclasticus sp.]
MSQHIFYPGQRWVSHSETELGLGVVESIEGRHVTLFYPAVEEPRVYALDNAPLSRVTFNVGDTVSHQGGQEVTIEQTQEHNHCMIYLCIDGQGEQVVLHEIDLDSTGAFNKPQSRLFTGQLDKNKLFDLRLKTLDFQRKLDQFKGFGLSGPRVQLLPHQFYIASKVTERNAARVLLADEVGLGKTIEAGLILHQQLLTGSIERVLIVVPDALIHQWLVELLRRFNLSFTILDRERCDAIREEGDINPFETAQLVLCQLSFLSENANYHASAVAANWDLMIVDEAHHLFWNENNVSNEYRCIEELANHVPGLLLLTATPEQLGVTSHFARLRLLDPDRYYDLAAFREEQAGYQEINQLIKQLMAANSIDGVLADVNLKQSLLQLLGEQAVLSDDISVDSLIDALLDRHGTGRVLFRNTRENIDAFSSRKLHAYQLPALSVENEFELDTDLALAKTLLPEMLLGEDWLMLDPRITWLVEWLDTHKNEKVLLICAQQQTAQELHEYLKMRTIFASAVFHEGMSLIERDRAAAYFSDAEEGAQILICSEIGSEGRNFQFAHHLVLFDLPLNPDLLEQRIGRLDRIGQTDTVHLHVPCIEGTGQHRLMNWYDKGLNAFSHVCSTGHHVYAIVKADLKEALLGDASDDEFAAIIEKTSTLMQQSIADMHAGRDLMLELNSCRKEQAQEIIDEISLSSSHLELSHYMEEVFESFGVEQQYHSEDSIVIKPSGHLQSDAFPSLPEDGLTATFNRKIALSREDFQFLTWEHPMVTGAMEQIINSEFGNSTFCTMALPPIPAGTVILEAIFTTHCPAPKRLQLHRYLPKTVKRIVVGSNGLDMTDILKPEHIESRVTFVKKSIALNIIEHGQEAIKTLIEKAEKLVVVHQEALVKQSVEEMQQQESLNLERLVALARVNPNIRDSEITQLKANINDLGSYIKRASFKLDAIRVILTTD